MHARLLGTNRGQRKGTEQKKNCFPLTLHPFKKKKISMSGNRTRGVRVTGGNVTDYTNMDLKRLHDSDSLHRWKKLSVFEFSFPGKRSL